MKRKREESQEQQIKNQEKTPQKIQKSKNIQMFQKYDKNKQKSLPRSFFRQQVVQLAKQLLGKVFVRKTQQGQIRAVIVQTQAYKAPLDKACHAYDNKKTERTKYFWLDGGFLYLYTIYMPTNICLNVVAGLEGQPQAVLIRAVQPIQGLDIIKKHRKIQSKKIQDLTNGPGKIGQSLLINKQKMNGIDLLAGQFKIVDGNINEFEMGISKRINIDYAQEWIDKEWRFFIKNNSFVSKVPPAKKKQEKGSKKE